VLSQKTKEERCVILSNDKKIAKLGSYWTRNRPIPANDGILIYDRETSIIGCEYKYPRAGVGIHKVYLTQLHRYQLFFCLTTRICG